MQGNPDGFPADRRKKTGVWWEWLEVEVWMDLMIWHSSG
jgi:hypothetical protein